MAAISGLLILGLSVLVRQSVLAESCHYHESMYEGLNLTTLSQELTKTGLVGEIHGAVSSSQMYVLSVREPNNFFNFQHFSLIAVNEAIQKQLSAAKRHDQVCIQGQLINNISPQPHILVKSMKILEHWSGLDSFPTYYWQKDIPDGLKQQNQLVGKVHTVQDHGRILVVEYEDAILPIFVPTPQLTESLYRGDIVRIHYQLQTNPQEPTHLQFNFTVEKPLEVLTAIADWQGKNQTLLGKLVKFPQSPQLKFDVYGIEVMTQGIPHYFTLVNFEDFAEFENIREKLAKIWNAHPDTIQRGRNFLINPNITIEAQGKLNIASPNQANPQILLENSEKIRQIL